MYQAIAAQRHPETAESTTGRFIQSDFRRGAALRPRILAGKSRESSVVESCGRPEGKV
jgi:hypothetical protein